jgi:hypothetical protein
MEVRTEPLEEGRLEGQLRLLYELCPQLDSLELDVSYGWACHLDIDRMWQDHRIPASELVTFIGQAISEGIVELGGSDLHINGVHAGFTFTLCHESDLHFRSDDPTLVARVTTAWREAGIRYFEVP